MGMATVGIVVMATAAGGLASYQPGEQAAARTPAETLQPRNDWTRDTAHVHDDTPPADRSLFDVIVRRQTRGGDPVDEVPFLLFPHSVQDKSKRTPFVTSPCAGKAPPFCIAECV